MPIEPPHYAQVVAFWRSAGGKKWWSHDPSFDADIRDKFEALHHAGARGELIDWADDAEGALALLILLDQFPRNMYRGSAHSYATDGLAHSIAERALVAGFDQKIEAELRTFFYLPFEHSERPASQARAVALFTMLGDESTLKFARLHADIIRRFGRFPHRNEALGRASTAEEIAFLKDGGFAG